MSEIHFVQVDAEKMISEAKSALEREIGERLLPGDERLLTLLHVMQHIIGTYALINQVGQSNLLRYAAGEVLDAMGERVATGRIQVGPAETTLAFTLASAQQVAVNIPAGTRATPDGEVYFATTKLLVIPAGSTTGSVLASMQLGDSVEGAKYNGYPPGSINALVDAQLFDMRVENTDESHGGMNRESDEAYRERIMLAPTRFSTAGPKDAYIYHALSANSAVIDAEALRTAPGEITVTLLLEDGLDDPDAIIAGVLDYLNDRTIRPLTDLVHVEAAEPVEYDVELVYYVTLTEEAAVVEAVQGEQGAIAQYHAWQDKELGRDIDPDRLRLLMFAAGAQRIEMAAPVFTEVAATQRARRRTLTIRHEVLPL